MSQLPLSDVTPGIDLPAIDRSMVIRQLDGIRKSIEDLYPIVKREGGLFVLYHCELDQRVVVKAASAQMMVDYLNAVFPVGTKVRWIILPQ